MKSGRNKYLFCLGKNMISRSVILNTFALYSYCYGAIVRKNGCSISINEDLSNPQPLLLLQNDAVNHIDAFPLPENDEGTLTFDDDEKINIACPGGTVVVNEDDTKEDFVEATCRSGTKFVVNDKAVPFTDITCSTETTHTARYTGNTCAGDHKEIEIGFEVQKRFIKHITTCFDDKLQSALYSHSKLSKTIAGHQKNYRRPTFQVGSFYKLKSATVHKLFTQKGQRKTINDILGLEEDDESIIQPHSNFYLATGHYIPKADFIYGAQQRLTFYYVNAAPQWQTFNGGNWKAMEGDCRNYAAEHDVDLEVYTGSYNITSLEDAKGKDQQLYLWIGDDDDKGIPVPAMYYKVIYEPVSQAGVALVGINNPYKKGYSKNIFCTDVCDKISWLSWKSDDVTLGYSYCCKVDDFRSRVKHLPDFKVKSLLV